MPSKRDAMTARALALVGCGYIYGATGWICTRARMEQQMRQYPTYAGQIERYGKKWLGKPCYDCAQLTRDVARRAGVRLPSGATSQWQGCGHLEGKRCDRYAAGRGGAFSVYNARRDA